MTEPYATLALLLYVCGWFAVMMSGADGDPAGFGEWALLVVIATAWPFLLSAASIYRWTNWCFRASPASQSPDAYTRAWEKITRASSR